MAGCWHDAISELESQLSSLQWLLAATDGIRKLYKGITTSSPETTVYTDVPATAAMS